MIIYGHNNFNRLTVNPTEIGLFDNSYANITFQLRQRYAHIFWIPIFPLAQVWIVNKGDGKLYECPFEIRQILNERFAKKGPSVFAFSGLLLVAIIGLFYYISEKVSSYQSQKNYEARIEKEGQDATAQVNTLHANEFLIFSSKAKDESYFSSEGTVMKVLDVNGDAVTLGTYTKRTTTITPSVEDARAGAVKTEDEVVSAREEGVASTKTSPVISYFDADDVDQKIIKIDVELRLADTIKVSKGELQKAIAVKANDKEFKGVELKDFSADKNFKLEKIKDLRGPILKEKSDAAGKSSNYFEITNYGYAANADSIVSQTPAVQWQLSKMHYMGTEETIAVKNNGKGKAILYCSDGKKNVYKFNIDNESYSVNIERAE